MPLEIFTFANRPRRKAIPSGSRIRVEHALRYDEFGNKYLAEVGTFDQYAYIQSFAASCDINEIIRRATPEQMAAFGQGVYADISAMPKTLADSYKVLHDAESLYHSLGDDIKSQYGDYRAFLNSFGTLQGVTDFLSKMTKKNAAAAQDPAAAQPQGTAVSTNSTGKEA